MMMVNLLPIPCCFIPGDKKSSLKTTKSDACCWIPPPRISIPRWCPRKLVSPFLSTKPLSAVDELSLMTSCIKSALILIATDEDDNENDGGRIEENTDTSISCLSKAFALALLKEPDTNPYQDHDQNNETTDDYCEEDYETISMLLLEYKDDNDRIKFKGLPRRPYYREISQRLWQLMQKYYTDSYHDDEQVDGIENMKSKEEGYSYIFPRPLINAEELNIKEQNPPPILFPIQHPITTSSCQQWLHDVGENGIRELLGMRHTIGTRSSCLPPDHEALMASARKPCKPKAKPPHLSVAARARSKHAHRGSEQFYGIVTGTTQKKNDDAEVIVRGMLDNAVWMNIHEFGGVDEPVIEMRNDRGYGARWGGDWSVPDYPVNMSFRGFLEPHREDGFENNWRH